DATGSWVLTRLTTDPTGSPFLRADAAGHLHIVYVSQGFSPGLYHLTNATGSWVSERVASGHLLFRPEPATGATGVLSAVVASPAPETRGIWMYQRSGTAAWTASRITTKDDVSPSIALDAAGKAHVSFERITSGARGLLYATNKNGAWSVQSVIS